MTNETFRGAPGILGGKAFRRLVAVFGAISVLATVVVVVVSGNPRAILDAIGAVEPRWYVIIALAIVVEWALDVLRYYTTALAVGVRLGPKLVTQITFANLFFAYLTPGGGFGAPIVTFMLFRAGVGLPRAIAISLIKPLISMFVLIPSLTLMTAIGGHEFVGTSALQAVIASAGGIVWTGIMLLLVCSIWPLSMQRVLDGPLRWVSERPAVQRRFPGRMEKLREGVRSTIGAFSLYLRSGWVLPFLSFVTAVGNIAAICGIGVVLLQGLGAVGGQVQLWGLSLLYVAVISISPTPGASGIAEGSGLALFDSVFDTTGPVAAFVLLWRVLTCYLPLVLGGVLFARFLAAAPGDVQTGVASITAGGPGVAPLAAAAPATTGTTAANTDGRVG
jgi:hypothetical protein